MEANGAIAIGGSFYGALDGKISATVSGSIQGRNLEATAADGEIVECILLYLQFHKMRREYHGS